MVAGEAVQSGKSAKERKKRNQTRSLCPAELEKLVLFYVITSNVDGLQKNDNV
jgi:hypothetical protein